MSTSNMMFLSPPPLQKVWTFSEKLTFSFLGFKQRPYPALIKNATKIGIEVMSLVVIPVTTTRITKRRMGVSPIGFGATELVGCTGTRLCFVKFQKDESIKGFDFNAKRKCK